MDSIYTQCSIAARELAEAPEPFDESDVVQAAAATDWSEEDYRVAEKHAPQVLAAMFRASRLVRFGVVDPENAPLTGEKDYVRKAGHILYANLDKWEEQKLDTPNGEFAAILYRRDPVFKNGRRRASERDDFQSWADQHPQPDDPRPDVTALRRESARLRAALTAADKEIARLEAENQRLRSNAADAALTT